MSKTITVSNTHPQPFQLSGDVVVDVDDFVTFARRVQSGETLTTIPNRWAVAAFAVFDDRGEVVLSPRGEDLLASAHLIPDDPEPVQVVVDPCDACNGTGERVLFVSMQTCDVCKGSKVKPRMNGYFQASNAAEPVKYFRDAMRAQFSGIDMASKPSATAIAVAAGRNQVLTDLGRHVADALNVPYGYITRFHDVRSTDPEAPRRGDAPLVTGIDAIMALMRSAELAMQSVEVKHSHGQVTVGVPKVVSDTYVVLPDQGYGRVFDVIDIDAPRRPYSIYRARLVS